MRTLFSSGAHHMPLVLVALGILFGCTFHQTIVVHLQQYQHLAHSRSSENVQLQETKVMISKDVLTGGDETVIDMW